MSKPKSRLSKAKPRCPRRSRGGRGCVKAPMVASEDVLHDSWHLRRLIGRHAAAYGHAYGQTSPHAEDRMRRRQLREGVYEERPAVILGDLVAVHDAFQNKYPECKVPFESFCLMVPWYMRMRETSRVATSLLDRTGAPSLPRDTGLCLRRGMSISFREQATQRAPTETVCDCDWAESVRVPAFATCVLQSDYWSAEYWSMLPAVD